MTPLDDTAALLDRARGGDERAFSVLAGAYRSELRLHCYRMLGSMTDADDAVQETLLAAWRGLAGFAGRSSLRTWLYTIATRVCLRLAEQRPPRMLSWDAHPARDPLGDLGVPDAGTAWLEPWLPSPDDPGELSARRESVSLAFLAALQLLPPNQRAALLLRDVLGYSAAETAELLDTSVASANSALQRARATLERSGVSPEATATAEASVADRQAVDAFVTAFEAGDVPALIDLLAEEVRFTMPPLPAWFDGRDDVAAFLEHRSLVTPWRVRRRLIVNGAPALLADQWRDGEWHLSALMVLTIRDGRVAWIASFLDPATLLAADSVADR